jgi:uncharacterized protein YprB with RNaseH-like and TPR domain
VFDLETSNLNAEWGVILCCCVKEYCKAGVKEFRADEFPNWKVRRSNDRQLVEAIIKELEQYDILCAHNGQFFDKSWLLAKAIKYDIPNTLRYKKFIDPVRLARRNFKLGSNGLMSLINFLNIPTTKTRIRPEAWLEASLDGNTKAMDEIVYHCRRDVLSLNGVYHKMRPLIERIDNRGSAQ